MPELPEVESVRRGLADLVTGARVDAVAVRHPRLLRDQAGGAQEFAGRLTGRRLGQPRRRGKFLWVPLVGDSLVGVPVGTEVPAVEALALHLGMSGQVRVVDPRTDEHPHTRVVLDLDGDRQLRVVDQRMFGRLRVDDLVPDTTADGGAVPAHAAHIALDPLEPAFDTRAFLDRLRSRRTAVKRALLDQTLISGIGNIYADESLWRARLHGDRPTEELPVATGRRLVAHVVEVLTEAVAAGGTSFDALYVDVNGESGRHGTSLAVYGREGLPCPRCGRPVSRAAFTNRSSFWCPGCQRLPSTGRVSGRHAAA